MKRLLAVGPPDLVIEARERIPIETWPLTSDHRLPGSHAQGCEGRIDDDDEERVIRIFRDWGCLAVAVDAESPPEELVRAVTALSIAFRRTDGGPQQG